MFQNGERVTDSTKFLNILQSAFHPVLNKEGQDLLEPLVEKFAYSETEHLKFVPNEYFFNQQTGSWYGVPFVDSEADFLFHQKEGEYHHARNRILTSTHSLAPREVLQKAPQTETVRRLLAWLDKYEKRGHEEFPSVAKNLIEGKPAGIYR